MTAESTRRSTIELAAISHIDACLLSRVFNAASNLRVSDASRVNDWLKSLIAFSRRCAICHGSTVVNFERGDGWDETCKHCAGTGVEP